MNDTNQHRSSSTATDSVVLRTIAWKDLCPWLMLFRCPGIALRFDILFLATTGAVLTSLAWMLAGWVFYFGSPVDDVPDGVPQNTEQRQTLNIALIHQDFSQWPGSTAGRISLAGGASAMPDAMDGARIKLDGPSAHLLESTLAGREPFHASWRNFTRPYLELFSLRVTLQQFAYLLLGSLLTLLVWSQFGGAIVRCAAMQLAHDERIGPTRALKFAGGKLFSYFASPLFRCWVWRRLPWVWRSSSVCR